jgi:hypothetical protein
MPHNRVAYTTMFIFVTQEYELSCHINCTTLAEAGQAVAACWDASQIDSSRRTLQDTMQIRPPRCATLASLTHLKQYMRDVDTM